MKTAVGIFSNADRAEEAIRALIKNQVPPERITLLTRSESDANRVGRHLPADQRSPAATGNPAQFSVLSIPGMNPVLVQGPDVNDLFEPPVAAGSNLLSAPRSPDDPWRKTFPNSGEEDDSAYFRRVLDAGSSVIVVRSDSHRVATAACEVLDKLSLGVGKAPSTKSQVSVRQVPGGAIATFSGKLALDDGCKLLRETVRAFLDAGQLRILLNLEHLGFLDSAGLGELVRTHVAVRNRGGQLTLVNPSPSVRHLLRLTRMDNVFDFAPDELTALNRSQKTG